MPTPRSVIRARRKRDQAALRLRQVVKRHARQMDLLINRHTKQTDNLVKHHANQLGHAQNNLDVASQELTVTEAEVRAV